MKHSWYLTPQMITVALCDPGLSEVERDDLADAIWCSRCELAEMKLGKPTLPTVEWSDERPKLATFVTKESFLIFHLLKIQGNFLEKKSKYWSTDDEFVKFQTFCLNLPSLNDIAERGVKLVQDFKDSCQDETDRQNILLAAQEFRESLPDLSKRSLANML